MLTHQVEKQFGSFDNLEEEMTKKAVPVQGSGWGWLAWDNISKSLRIVDTPNQEMLAPQGLTPLLSNIHIYIAIDVWEHAYYVDYKNVRMDYVKQIWKIVNWKDVEKRFISVSVKKWTSINKLNIIGSTVIGSTVIGSTVIGSTVIGATVIGSTVIGATVIGSTVIGATVIGATVKS